MKYVIGVDQGGSGTRAVVCTLDGRLLGLGFGPGACHPFDGMDAAMEATKIALSGALRATEVPLKEAVGFAGGYTGADWPDEYDLLRDAVLELDLTSSVYIVNDCRAAFRGGTEQPTGGILVAGSGANCAVRAPDGREFIYHYYHDNDLQGGSALGNAALKAIYRAETGRPPQTSLRERVLNFYKMPDVDSLMRGMEEGKLPSSRPHDIAPFVFDEGKKGDQAAINIITYFGVGCAELLVNGIKRLEMTDLDFEIVLSGGIFKAKSPLLRKILTRDVKKEVPHARFVDARYEPVVGAALLALENAGIHPDNAVKSNIEASARKQSLLRL
jgi:N-acetylglucosamine kinase-like BadF-type ATPase